MKIISWNIRGLGSRRKMVLLKDYFRQARADIIILQETKTVTIDRKLVASVWGSRFKDWVFAPARGSSGGIVVMWNTKHISVVESLVGVFSVSIKIRESNGLEWWLSRVYGPCKYRERQDLWEELAGLYGLCSPRWCVGGDFNVVRFENEKSNGGRPTASMRIFNQFIQDSELIDPDLLNAQFTWSNFQEETVCRRLDTFLFSGGWEESFPHAR
ncbi:hypothetical protein FF1_039826 [Malus domestica]